MDRHAWWKDQSLKKDVYLCVCVCAYLYVIVFLSWYSSEGRKLICLKRDDEGVGLMRNLWDSYILRTRAADFSSFLINICVN